MSLVRPALVPAALALVALVLAACGDEPKRRLGSACDEDPECGSGACYEGACIDPSVDADGDGLINREELRLGTDPYDDDSDGDLERDPDELGADLVHLDGDLDGTPDALESQLADRDADCLADEVDADDEAADPTACPEVTFVLGEPSGWYTSEGGREVTMTVALASDPGRAADVELDAGDEATVTPARLRFSSDDWARPRTITVRGADDEAADGHVGYDVTLAVTSPFLRGGAAVPLVNADDDLPASARALEDFNGGRELGVWVDEPRQRSDTRITGGVLVHALDALGATGAIGHTQGLDVDLTTVTSVEARVAMLEVDATLGRHEAVLRMLFQPPALRGGTREGLVGVELALGRDALDAGPRALPRVWSCADAACVTSYPMAAPTPVGGAPSEPVAVELGEVVTMGLALDRAQGIVTFTIGADRWTLALAGGPVGVADLLRVDLGAFASPDRGESIGGRTRMSFDGVAVDGAAWDDFTSGRLAQGRWLDALAWNEVEDGALTLEVQGDLPWFGSRLTLADASAVRGLVAEVTLAGAFDPGGDAVGAIVGGRVGDAAIEGDASITGPLEAHVVVFADRQVAIVRSVLGTWQEDLGPSTLGQATTALVAWDGTDVTLQAGTATVLFRPARVGLVVRAGEATLGVSAEGFPSAREVATGRVIVDDIGTLAQP